MSSSINQAFASNSKNELSNWSVVLSWQVNKIRDLYPKGYATIINANKSSQAKIALISPDGTSELGSPKPIRSMLYGSSEKKLNSELIVPDIAKWSLFMERVVSNYYFIAIRSKFVAFRFKMFHIFMGVVTVSLCK